jgi:hypothetical protein
VWTHTADGWRLAHARPVRLDAGADGEGELLTAGEVDAARARRDATLAAFAERCREVEREAEAYRAAVVAGVPPGCPTEVGPLLHEVVRLSTECLRLADPGAREECFARRETLNRKLGDCQEQDEAHERALAAAERQAAEFRRQHVASLAAELQR